MNDLLKNRKLYYILMPVAAAIWPLYAGLSALPAAEENWSDLKADYTRAQVTMLDILELDPERLAASVDPDKFDEFDYSTEVEKVAESTGIPGPNYKLNVRRAIKVSGQDVQSATLTLENVDVTRIALFIATIQSHWPNLECDQIKLDKQQGKPDLWKAMMQFKYYK